MPKGVSNQPPGGDLRERFGKEARRQFSPKLILREARALIMLAMALDLSITDTIARLVREEWARRGRNVEADPVFDPPVAVAAE